MLTALSGIRVSLYHAARALGLAMILILAGAGAEATARPQDPQLRVTDAPGASPVISDSVAAPQPAVIAPQPLGDAPYDPTAPLYYGTPMPSANSLAEMVAAVQLPATISRDLECLAGAIYFEAQSESLEGQLAVGRVVVARAASGRFPASYCGVVLQRSQFSFVRGGAIPAVDHANRHWQTALRLAMIADRGAWRSQAEGALYFHAARAGGVAGKTRVAQIQNHVFYR